ncbi:PREDICTED: venom allergen 5.02-like [Branchiostoma belcheri]|uniref:Venom allergen 5.02-like n=1 Tax=Branchiostoma belcheri TaxID=7741 RepID=A0A6P5A9C5_BRABE|nr:PREDICTED: venom allergen 5.02-like [Branchiostoma belcheri]
MLGLCESQNYHVWMKKQCAASCGICVAEESDCQNKYGDETCKKFTDHRFHLMPQFQYFMACSCAKASGICTTALATPAPTLQAIDDEDEVCLRLQNEKRSQHGAAPLVWCQECADFAKTVVQTMQDLNEPLHHTSPEERTWLVEGKEVLHGSNLQYEFPHVDCEIAVESWYSETEFYDPNRPVESLEQAGHFTQMVWKDTKSVGCAWTENYLACIYEPTGNTENAYDIERNVQP